jgi:hypothetical protein
MRQSRAEIIREYGPFPGVDQVGGVTWDGERIWIAARDTLDAIDPESGSTVRSHDVTAHAGTAFDGRHLFQIAERQIRKIDPATGRVLATIPAPGDGGDSGLESDGGDRFFCGGGKSGRVRAVRRPKRGRDVSAARARSRSAPEG